MISDLQHSKHPLLICCQSSQSLLKEKIKLRVHDRCYVNKLIFEKYFWIFIFDNFPVKIVVENNYKYHFIFTFFKWMHIKNCWNLEFLLILGRKSWNLNLESRKRNLYHMYKMIIKEHLYSSNKCWIHFLLVWKQIWKFASKSNFTHTDDWSCCSTFILVCISQLYVLAFLNPNLFLCLFKHLRLNANIFYCFLLIE